MFGLLSNINDVLFVGMAKYERNLRNLSKRIWMRKTATNLFIDSTHNQS